MLMLLAGVALANDFPIEATPFGFIRPQGSWIQNDDTSSADQDGFFVQARLGAKVKLNVPSALGPGLIEGSVEAELTPEFSLKDGWVRYQPHPTLMLTVGQQKIPFSPHQLASDTRRQLPLSPRTLTALNIGRDIGAVFQTSLPYHGKVRAMGYAGMFNGEGSNRIQNVNEEFLYALRGVITPFGARETAYEGTGRNLYLGVGGGWVYNLTGEGEGAQERNAFGVDLQFAWRWLSFQAEAMDVEVFNASIDVSDFHSKGMWYQLGSFIPAPWTREHLELVGRLEWTEPNTAFSDTGLVGSGATAIPAFQSARLITGGINLYFLPPREDKPARFHDAKLQLAYTHATELEGDPVADDNLVGVLSLRF